MLRLKKAGGDCIKASRRHPDFVLVFLRHGFFFFGVSVGFDCMVVAW